MNYIRMYLLLLVIFILSACGATSQQDEDTHQDTLEIYTTVYPLEDFTKKIGGDYVDVESIYPPGADEHTFEPSQKDMIKMADGDIFFYVGMGLEGFVEGSKSILESEDVTVVATSKGIDLEPGGESSGEHDHDDGHNHDVDPHIWLDPVYSKEMAKNIADTLSNEMPEHKKRIPSEP